MAISRSGQVSKACKYAVITLAVVFALNASTPTTATCPKPYTLSAKELKCLADNVYHEARGEPWKGQILVAKVTLNRAVNSSICKEVYRPYQFSWTLRPQKIKDRQAYATAKQAALTAINYRFNGTHYHALHVAPKWAKRLKHITTVNNHKFYE